MSVFRFARLIPGTTQLHETGHYADRASAELEGHRRMVAERHAGGVIVEHISGLEHEERVVAIANVLRFEDFADGQPQALRWWHGLSEESRQHFASGSLDLRGPVLGDVGPDVIMLASINHGPYTSELIPQITDFIGAIVGEPVPWLEGAPVHLLRE